MYGARFAWPKALATWEIQKGNKHAYINIQPEDSSRGGPLLNRLDILVTTNIVLTSGNHTRHYNPNLNFYRTHKGTDSAVTNRHRNPIREPEIVVHSPRHSQRQNLDVLHDLHVIVAGAVLDRRFAVWGPLGIRVSGCRVYRAYVVYWVL